MNHSVYRLHVEEVLLPFWNRALDHQYGGVFTCYNNGGDQLLHSDKYIWSQGRFLWLWSKAVSLISANRLNGDAETYHAHLQKTVQFIEKNAFLEDGSCAFLLTKEGHKKESVPGKGYNSSIYADCFVVIGLSEYAGMAKDLTRFETALNLYYNIRRRLKQGTFRTEPYPIPENYRSHSIPMIMLNVAQELTEAAEELSRPEAAALLQHSESYMNEILRDFYLEGERIIEMLPENPAQKDTLLYRHINPGHTLESMWFVLHTALKTGDSGSVLKSVKMIEKTVQAGWDNDFGGLFRFVDCAGGRPQGRRTGHAYEILICDSWDMKLWWPHSEALYSTLLAWKLTESAAMKSMYERVADYVFRTFPNPDKQVGEWIQIRDRAGQPLEKIAALPVKDPFHILRNLFLAIELLEE